jgi:F subunit of K+-transporting ATPase (Potass_KdpF)
VILALAMGIDNLAGIFISVLAVAYLAYALIRPEKL